MTALLSVSLLLTTIFFLTAEGKLRQHDYIANATAGVKDPPYENGLVPASSYFDSISGVVHGYIVPVPECYSCTGCTNVDTYTAVKSCANLGGKPGRHKCVTFVEKYANMDRPWYIRGCATDRTTCAEIKHAYSNHKDIVKLLSCYECEGDRCNKSSLSHSLSFVSIAFFVIIVPLITTYTLS